VRIKPDQHAPGGDFGPQMTGLSYTEGISITNNRNSRSTDVDRNKAGIIDDHNLAPAASLGHNNALNRRRDHGRFLVSGSDYKRDAITHMDAVQLTQTCARNVAKFGCCQFQIMSRLLHLLVKTEWFTVMSD
jgi:hypothetical protein